jgi:NAD(P)H-dependent flavin oxidoreductase YrpB (nitropropane dioxygenase family)
MLTTAYTELVGCRLPIQQAPMGSVVTPELVVAVAEAGGVGSLTAHGMSHDTLATLLDRLTAATRGAIAVNFITGDVDPAAVEVAARRVRIVDFFWRDPDPVVIEVAHSAGALVSWQVGSVAEARAAVDAGADIVAAQGADGGGHVRGHSAMLPLLVAVLDAVDVPVLAAGGIADPRGLAAVLAAGAAGARIGTRFIATEESGAHPEYVAALLAAGPGSTEVTGAFANCPLCASSPRARVLRSAIAAVDGLDEDVVGTMVMGGGEQPVPRRFGMPPSRAVTGRIDAMPLYAGEGVMLVESVEPAGALARRLAEGAERLLRSSAAVATVAGGQA